MKEQLIKKFTSRKFIVTMVSTIAGLLLNIALILGENPTIQIIAGAAMTIIPTIVYCIMEGKIDAANVQTITTATADAADKLGASSTIVETIEKTGDIVGIIVENEESSKS